MRTVFITAAAMLAAGCAVPEGRAPAEAGPWVVGDIASALEVGIAQGEVRLTLHLSNTSASPLEMTFPTSQRYDFAVEDGEGREVWRWSADRAFAQVVTEATLAPDETWTMEAAWEPGGRAGSYVAVGWVMAQDFPLVQRAPFELP